VNWGLGIGDWGASSVQGFSTLRKLASLGTRKLGKELMPHAPCPMPHAPCPITDILAKE
jgi:hypothetical protein